MKFLLELPALLKLARQSVSDPRGGARFMMGLNLPRGILLQFYLLQLVLSAMSKLVFFLLMPLPEGIDAPTDAVMSFTAFEGMVGLMIAFGAHRIGQLFGGKGTFDQALTLVIWAQFILLVLSVVQILVLLVLPPLSDIITMLALALFFWLMVNFVTELHGFTSPGLVFVGILFSLMGLAILLSILFSAMGLRLV
ncbi:YIP1 family protein [Nioella sp.]|uniref:YIP1 family protein n=1 Tax=Nioella sp. TaxID=1912091 RepID=UPI003513A7B4